ncbi:MULTISPECIES: hypothetical protein [Nocardia]|uniref:hypothetical protein n=1 Tax=Nocardia TaxID=1817 RepID=UPI002458C930|nr:MULTISPECIES: hypothetical protein [Nocardia]
MVNSSVSSAAALDGGRTDPVAISAAAVGQVGYEQQMPVTPFPAARQWLEQAAAAAPGGSRKVSEFDGGGRWRIEVPTVNSAAAAQALLEGAQRNGLTINRITETAGMMVHTAEEIGRYVSICAEHGVQLLMSIGPRATYDIGAAARTPEGARNGLRLRGGDQLEHAIADVQRGLELGVRGFVVYDEGLLMTLGILRDQKTIPADVHLKVSAHCGHGNPASMMLLAGLGADSINPVRDLPINHLAALRAAVKVPLDVHVDNPKSSGGFVRVMDVPRIVEAASPVHLKTGNGVMEGHGLPPTPQQVEGMLQRVQLTTEAMRRYRPDCAQSPNRAAVGV